jgi:uncharacterized protein YecT (DUF1311 family)
MKLVIWGALLCMLAQPALAAGKATDQAAGKMAGKSAAKVDCKAATGEDAVATCAEDAYKEADAALADVWPKAKAAADAKDTATKSNKHSFRDTLVAAEKAWLTYRAAECDWESSEPKGDLSEPVVMNQCLARLTMSRANLLKGGLAPK